MENMTLKLKDESVETKISMDASLNTEYTVDSIESSIIGYLKEAIESTSFISITESLFTLIKLNELCQKVLLAFERILLRIITCNAKYKETDNILLEIMKILNYLQSRYSDNPNVNKLINGIVIFICAATNEDK